MVKGNIFLKWLMVILLFLSIGGAVGYIVDISPNIDRKHILCFFPVAMMLICFGLAIGYYLAKQIYSGQPLTSDQLADGNYLIRLLHEESGAFLVWEKIDGDVKGDPCHVNDPAGYFPKSLPIGKNVHMRIETESVTTRRGGDTLKVRRRLISGSQKEKESDRLEAYAQAIPLN